MIETASPDKKKIAKYAIIAAIAIALIAYIVITAIPKKTDSGNSLPNTPNSGKPAQTSYPDILPDGSSSEPAQSQPADSNVIVEDHVKLYAGLDEKNRNIVACYAYIPAGYEATEKALAVYLKPEGLDLSVTGNSALILGWTSIANFEDVRTYGTYIDSKIGTYELLEQYAFAAHESLTAQVFVIKTTFIKEGYDACYTIVADIGDKGLHPAIQVYESDLDKYLTARYPDITSLAKAIFRPA